MLRSIHPKLPMRNKLVTKEFYLTKLGFSDIGIQDFPNYLILKKDEVEIHFFEFKDLNPLENYGQVYIRVEDIDRLYSNFLANNVSIHPNSPLEIKSWGQKEFAVLDPDHNLLTFGEELV